MSIAYKNISSDYTITVNNGIGIFTVNAANTVFSGNVITTGSAVNSTPFFTVAANNTGAITDMGLLGQTGPTTYAGLRYDSTVGAWQISSNVAPDGSAITNYANISTGGVTVAGINTQVQFNNAGSFGASANLTFDYSNSRLKLQGPQAYGNIGTTPAIVSNAVVVYNKPIGGGGTGLYVVSSAVNDELVSKSKAIVYGIIF